MKGDNLISPEEKEKIRVEIKSRIEETRKSILSLQEQSKPVAPDRAIGRITRMDAIQQRSVSEANLRSAEEALFKLEEALGKVDNPSFGVCVRCGQRIPLERILIIPETRHCVPCLGQM